MPRSRIGAILGGLVALVACGLTVATLATAERNFWVTPDPEFVLAELKHIGAQTGIGNSYVLYADGRVTSQRVSQAGDVFAEQEYEVAPRDVDELVQHIMEAGLYESDQAMFEAKMSPKRRTLHVPDASNLLITVALQHYQKDKDTPAREIRVSFSTIHPGYLTRHFPEVNELKCIDHISRWFQQYPPTPRDAR